MMSANGTTERTVTLEPVSATLEKRKRSDESNDECEEEVVSEGHVETEEEVEDSPVKRVRRASIFPGMAAYNDAILVGFDAVEITDFGRSSVGVEPSMDDDASDDDGSSGSSESGKVSTGNKSRSDDNVSHDSSIRNS